eukprot:gene17413-23650_t
MTSRHSPVLRSLLLLGLALGFAAGARAQFEMRGSGHNRLFISNTIVSLSLTDGGSGYVTAPTVTLSGGAGSGANITAILAGNVVSGFTIINAGTGYLASNPPTVTIAAPSSGVTARAVLVFRSIPDGTSPAAITPQFASVAANSAGSGSLTATGALSARHPSQIYLI